MTTFSLHDLKLVLDVTNPHTPAMVEMKLGGFTYSATYDVAVGMGELSGYDGEIALTNHQLEWLDTLASDVEEVFEMARINWER